MYHCKALKAKANIYGSVVVHFKAEDTIVEKATIGL